MHRELTNSSMINQQFLMAWMVCYFVLDINLSIYFSLISVLGVIPPQFIITWKEKNTMQSLQSLISIMGAKINFNIKSMCWVLVHVLVYVNELYKWQWPQWFCGRWSWNQRMYFEKKKKHLLVFSLEDYEFKLKCCQHWLLTQSLYGRCRVL